MKDLTFQNCISWLSNIGVHYQSDSLHLWFLCWLGHLECEDNWLHEKHRQLTCCPIRQWLCRKLFARRSFTKLISYRHLRQLICLMIYINTSIHSFIYKIKRGCIYAAFKNRSD